MNEVAKIEGQIPTQYRKSGFVRGLVKKSWSATRAARNARQEVAVQTGTGARARRVLRTAPGAALAGVGDAVVDTKPMWKPSGFGGALAVLGGLIADSPMLVDAGVGSLDGFAYQLARETASKKITMRFRLWGGA